MKDTATGLARLTKGTPKVAVTITHGDGDTPAEEKDEGFDKYHLESCVRTLAEASEIKADPKLMAALQPLLEKKVAGHKSLDQLRRLGAKKKAQGG